ncbi:hypothetical protein BDN70DRAFT_931572 [Pholiota conissans]|uniref:Uncharacterized protein n=1 Tax=Pholiota conissans TaxID=109636 RepID=A0A9P6CUK9_9AGAR|nr:hypothetical protein BDN70DRAFT_931572 [Pholiota conissans]
MSHCVNLEPNSVYVATQTIIMDTNNGTVFTEKFHWSLFITDTHGAVVQHHWNTRGTESGDEEYASHSSVASVQESTALSTYLVFTKIAPTLSSTLQHSLYNIFEDRLGIPYIRNRMVGISCRTFVIEALGVFDREKWLDFPSLAHQDLCYIETIIDARSKDVARKYVLLRGQGMQSLFRSHSGQIQVM